MKVRVVITETFTNEMRRALNAYYGKEGLATRADLKKMIRDFNPTGWDDILEEWRASLRLTDSDSDSDSD